MGWGGVCYDGKDGSCYEPGGFTFIISLVDPVEVLFTTLGL